MKKFLVLFVSLMLGLVVSSCSFGGSNNSSVDALKNDRNAAIHEVESYVSDLTVYSAENQIVINGIIISAKEEINVATSKTAIEEIVANSKISIDDVPTLVQEALALAILNANAELDEYVNLIDYSEAKQIYITAIIDSAKDEIAKCKTIAEVTAKLNATKSFIDDVPTLVEEALAEAKEAAKEEIENYISDKSVYSPKGLAEINRIINDAKNNIDEAIDTDIIDEIVNDAKIDLDSVKTLIEEQNENANKLKDSFVEDVGNFIDTSVSVDSGKVIIDTVDFDSTILHFGSQDKNFYSVFDTKIVVDYRSAEHSILTIRFRSWDLANGYLMEIHDGFINVYKLKWNDDIVRTLIVRNSFGIKDGEEVHLQILCHEWQKTVLINGVCIFSYSEGEHTVGRTYIETWQTGLTLVNPLYIEYADSASMKADYDALLWLESINKTERELLDEAKETAKSEVEGYIADLTQYSESNRTVIANIISEAKLNIDACNSKEEVLAAVQVAMRDLAAVKTLEREALDAEAASAKTELETYITDLTLYSEANQAVIVNIISNAKYAIDLANDIDSIGVIVTEAKAALDAVLTLEEEGTSSAKTFKNSLVNETPNLVENNVRVEGNKVIYDTKGLDDTLSYFGKQDGNFYSVFDTYIIADYRSSEWSSFSIRFRSWDLANGYIMEVHDGYIKVHLIKWDNGIVKTLLIEVPFGIKDKEEVHLQILCHEWQKTILINGQCIFSFNESARTVGRTYIETWQTGLTFINPRYIEHTDSASFMAEYGDLIWKQPAE